MGEEPETIAEGILDEARQEAERILREWRASAEDRRGSTEHRIADVAKEADERIEAERRRVLGRSGVQIAVEEKRARLRIQDGAFREVERRTLLALQELVGKTEYEPILLGWVVEACVGVGAEKATVNCSAGERDALQRVLPDAERRVAAALGHPVKISLSAEEPQREQGVVVVADDLPVAFSNRVVDRAYHMGSAIRRIIHDRLFKDSGNG